jgi:hypothetical protein
MEATDKSNKVNYSMYKLEVKLKQHTPLIHFQHDQEGATLRASEVKPKLDRFIIEHVLKSDFEKCKTYLIGYSEKNETSLKEKFDKGFRGLDYKMKILSDCEKTEYLIGAGYFGKTQLRKPANVKIIGNTSYFAQEDVNITTNEHQDGVIYRNGKGEDAIYTFRNDDWNKIEKKGIIWNNINIYISSEDEDLINKIKNNISLFFVAYNFGTRASKGFGCFSVVKINNDKPIDSIGNFEAYLKDFFGSYYVKRRINKNVLQDIAFDYKILKSELNFNKKYYKSKLFFYGIENSIRWEKRFLKKEIKSWLIEIGASFTLKDNKKPIYGIEPSEASWDDVKAFNYMYIRAVLGLAEQFEFATINNYIKIIAKVEVSSSGMDQKSKQIQRFASPLLFKVYNNNIYLVVNAKECLLSGKKVKFKLTLKIEPKYFEKAPENLKLKDAPSRTCILSIPTVDYHKFLAQALCREPYNKNDYRFDYKFCK